MVILTAKGFVRSAYRADFLCRMKKIMAFEADYKVCLQYDIFNDAYDEDLIFLYEVWEHQADLEEYLKEPFIEKSMKELNSMFPDGFEKVIYNIDRKGWNKIE